jgi:hypothetical protein
MVAAMSDWTGNEDYDHMVRRGLSDRDSHVRCVAHSITFINQAMYEVHVQLTHGVRTDEENKEVTIA